MRQDVRHLRLQRLHVVGSPIIALSRRYWFRLRGHRWPGAILVALVMVCVGWSVSPTGDCAGAGAALELTAHVVPANLARREGILVVAIVKNVSKAPVLFLPYKYPFAIGHITLKSLAGEPVQTLRGVEHPLIPPTRATDLVLLQPGEESRLAFSGYLLDTEKPDPDTGRMVSGFFLDFRNSAFLLPGAGSYEITVHFDWSQEVNRQIEATFGVQGLWSDALVSFPVRIEVQ
jgi:hypothetical protein